MKKTQKAQRAKLSNARHPFRIFLSSSEKNNFVIDHSLSPAWIWWAHRETYWLPSRTCLSDSYLTSEKLSNYAHVGKLQWCNFPRKPKQPASQKTAQTFHSVQRFTRRPRAISRSEMVDRSQCVAKLHREQAVRRKTALCFCVCDNSSFTVSTNSLQASLPKTRACVYIRHIHRKTEKLPEHKGAKTNLQLSLNKSSPSNGGEIPLKEQNCFLRVSKQHRADSKLWKQLHRNSLRCCRSGISLTSGFDLLIYSHPQTFSDIY